KINQVPGGALMQLHCVDIGILTQYYGWVESWTDEQKYEGMKLFITEAWNLMNNRPDSKEEILLGIETNGDVNFESLALWKYKGEVKIYGTIRADLTAKIARRPHQNHAPSREIQKQVRRRLESILGKRSS
ncbi:hypothetical protein KY320_00840, partial [Candidatus Woesearchaeota archaeon]|nr:hypothetical protein [Candidatus Woesearchaeota archaeon]